MGLLGGAKGSGAEKRLVPSFIAKFAHHFPRLDGEIMNAVFDLVEDDESLVSE